jgi:hypothetical protein
MKSRGLPIWEAFFMELQAYDLEKKKASLAGGLVSLLNIITNYGLYQQRGRVPSVAPSLKLQTPTVALV